MNNGLRASISRHFLSLSREELEQEIKSLQTMIKNLEKKIGWCGPNAKQALDYYKEKLFITNRIYRKKTKGIKP